MTDDETLLEERARRTRAVCEEIERAGGDIGSARVNEVAGELWAWLDARFPQEMGTRSRGGLDAMPVPMDRRGLARELYAAATVCDSLAVYYSADTFREMDQDAANVRHELAAWRRLTDQPL